MANIIIYGTHCPKCKVIEKKLTQKGIDFTMIDDPDKVLEFGTAHEIKTMPIVVIDKKILDFNEANQYINSL